MAFCRTTVLVEWIQSATYLSITTILYLSFATTLTSVCFFQQTSPAMAIFQVLEMPFNECKFTTWLSNFDDKFRFLTVRSRILVRINVLRLDTFKGWNLKPSVLDVGFLVLLTPPIWFSLQASQIFRYDQ